MPTWKSSPKLKPAISANARQPTPILQQRWKSKINIVKGAAQSHTKLTETTKCITGQFITLHREVIQFHPTEHKHKIPQELNLDSLPVQCHTQRSGSTADGSITLQPTESRPRPQQSKQNEKGEKYASGEGT